MPTEIMKKHSAVVGSVHRYLQDQLLCQTLVGLGLVAAVVKEPENVRTTQADKRWPPSSKQLFEAGLRSDRTNDSLLLPDLQDEKTVLPPKRSLCVDVELRVQRLDKGIRRRGRSDRSDRLPEKPVEAGWIVHCA